jgi:hypothetical protein
MKIMESYGDQKPTMNNPIAEKTEDINSNDYKDNETG